MTTITRYSKPQKQSSQANSVRLAEEVKAYRKAKLAFRVYASIGDFAKALKELMKLNEITRFSVHPEGACFSKYPARWTQGMLKLIPAKELINFRLEHGSKICFGNLEVIDSHLKQRRHKVVYNLIASKKLKVTRRELSHYIHECLAQQPYSYPLCFFADWGIEVNWVEQKLIRYSEASDEAPEGAAHAN